SGAGRRTHHRKSVQDDYLNGFPELAEGEEVARVAGSRGSNILQILCVDGRTSLAILPTKFRKLIWVKRGDYVIVSTSDGGYENSKGEEGKVRHMTEHILNQDQIKHLKALGKWPS
ncbi:unnamed protein product, partial [Chrysoparadoxa australica]